MDRFTTHSATRSIHLGASRDAGDATTPTDVLAIGPWQQREFAAALADVFSARKGSPAEKGSSAGEWLTVANMLEACQVLTDMRQPPELIFLAQPLPGHYCQADMDRLQQWFPLARLVVVAGSWCEGELRTGTLPTGVIRLYWYELASWWQAALRRRSAGLCPLWSLPLDHPLAGRFSLENVQQTPTPAVQESAILLRTGDFAVYEALSAALCEYGMSCTLDQEEPTKNVKAGIWDGGQLSTQELQQLTDFCDRVTGRVIALLDFPRVEHRDQVRAAGATNLLAKPYVVEELVMMLDP